MPRLWLLAALAFLGCANDFAPPSRVDTLRVLDVVPEPASGAPGQTSMLDLVVADAAPAADAAGVARTLQVAWLGGCHNPPSRQFFGCFPLLDAIATRLSARVIDTPAASLPAAVFGIGPRYALTVPEDILKNAPKAASDPVHFGVSYAFFAVCAGELRPRPDLTDRVPLECVDAQSGHALGRQDFVTGYATLYSYEGATNHNPVLPSMHFGAATVSPAPCTQDADCAGLVDEQQAGFSEVCGSQGSCALSLPACPASGECPTILVSPDVEPASAEALPGEDAHEIVWASFYSTHGSFDTATQLVNDRGTGFIADHGSYFHRPHTAGPTTIWVTVNDQRGGSAFQSVEVWTQ